MKCGEKSKAYTLFSQSVHLFLQATPTAMERKNDSAHYYVDKGSGEEGLRNGPYPKVERGSHGTTPGPYGMENILHQIIENCRPCISLRKVRLGRVSHEVPAPINKSKGQSLAVRWIIEFANKRKQKECTTFPRALSQELTNAYRKSGGPRQRRNEVHRLGQANRSAVRYRWW